MSGPDLGPLPPTDWLLYMPAKEYDPEWTSGMDGYSEDAMREYAKAAWERAYAAGVAAERERLACVARSLSAALTGDKT